MIANKGSGIEKSFRCVTVACFNATNHYDVATIWFVNTTIKHLHNNDYILVFVSKLLNDYAITFHLSFITCRWSSVIKHWNLDFYIIHNSKLIIEFQISSFTEEITVKWVIYYDNFFCSKFIFSRYILSNAFLRDVKIYYS